MRVRFQRHLSTQRVRCAWRRYVVPTLLVMMALAPAGVAKGREPRGLDERGCREREAVSAPIYGYDYWRCDGETTTMGRVRDISTGAL